MHGRFEVQEDSHGPLGMSRRHVGASQGSLGAELQLVMCSRKTTWRASSCNHAAGRYDDDGFTQEKKRKIRNHMWASLLCTCKSERPQLGPC